MNTVVATSVSLLSAGFILGLKHALDADHVAVVTTMVSQSKSLKKSTLLGALWGLGHTAALLIAGVVVLLVKITIPTRVALGLELVVGLVVIGFGLDVLSRIIRGAVHVHHHTHDSITHTHLHSHAVQSTHRHHHRALAVGALHGLAGNAALTLLVLTTIQSTLQGVAFILIFGLGSIISMLIISSAIGLPFLLTKRFSRLHTVIQATAGVVSVLVGLLIVYQLGFSRSLSS